MASNRVFPSSDPGLDRPGSSPCACPHKHLLHCYPGGVDRDFGKGIALHPGQLNSENAVQAGREHLTASAPASAAWGDDRPSVRTTVLRRLATRTIDLRAELLASERD